MGSNKVPITEYDRAKAPWYFVWYKFLEIVGLWFVTFGFYYIGLFVLETYPSSQDWFIEIGMITSPMTISSYWGVGFFVVGILALILYILFGLIKANWVSAKKKTESSKGKERRELLQKYEDRKEYGFCVGDEAEYICNKNYADNKERLGQKCIVGKIRPSGRRIYPLWKDGSKGDVDGCFIRTSSFKF